MAWFDLYFSLGYQSYISYQIHNRSNYTAIKNRIAALGMKLVDSQILDDGLSSVYVGKNYAIKIVSSGSKDSTVAKYIFTVLTKEIYLNSLD